MSVDSLYETMGLVRIVEMDPAGRSRLEYMAKPGMCHSGGVVQGGFVTGWIDAAMAHAVIAAMGDGITPMSLEIKVSFFAPVRPGLVVAEGWIERRGRKTIELMTLNHLPDDGDLASWSQSLFSEATNAGVGFGLGFAINLDPVRTMIPGSVGEFYWGGMYSTAFFVDPVEEITMVFMTQLAPSSTYPIRRELKTLIYSALV